MLRLVLTGACGLIFGLSYGQLKKFYTLKCGDEFEQVVFKLEATEGSCHMKSEPKGDPLSIYGNPDLNKINPSFKHNNRNGVCFASLALEEFQTTSLSDNILYAFQSSKSQKNNRWTVELSGDKVYSLDLNYGYGDASIDLSGTSVRVFKVKSGSADIYVDYVDGAANLVSMDTFLITADMGSVVARRLELARAKHVIANVGFGSASLDFRQAVKDRCTVNASVGAGNLEIHLPDKVVPMIIYFKDSPLCGRTVAEGFEEVDQNVYVNMAYSADAENLMTFNVDVAMGSVAFRYD